MQSPEAQPELKEKYHSTTDEFDLAETNAQIAKEKLSLAGNPITRLFAKIRYRNAQANLANLAEESEFLEYKLTAEE